MRFGESFPQGADPRNRMDVLNKEAGRDGLPAYIQFGLKIREQLRTKLEQAGWPDLPNPEDLQPAEDIFSVAKSRVDAIWSESAEPLINSQAEVWRQGLSDKNPELQEVSDLLADPNRLNKDFSLRQFGRLEMMRTANPEAWRSLIVASSEKQLAAIALMEHWLKTGDAEKIMAISETLSLSPAELRLFVDLAAILGKYIDQAYLKQLELADLPGGSAVNKLSEEEGAEYLYDLYQAPDSEAVEVKTYTDIFSFEWPKLQARFRALAAKTRAASQTGELSSNYQDFADYLEQLADVYGSKNTAPAVVDQQWNELYKKAKEIDEQGCQILLIPQGCAAVAGDAGKVDAEIRLGLKTKEIRQQAERFRPFIDIAQSWLDGQQANLTKAGRIPAVSLSYQPWSFGPNLYWQTRGESGEEIISSHTNVVAEVALAKEKPLLNKIFPQEQIADAQYAPAAVVETGLHEIAHNFLESGDKKIFKRIGTGFEADILEELKAETVSLKILGEAHRRGQLPNDFNLRHQLLAKLGTNLDYLKNKSSQKMNSGEPYYLCGTTIIGALLNKGLIKKSGETYEIGETEECLDEISKLSDQVLAFYTNNTTKPVDVKNYIKLLRQQSTQPELREFLKEI